jgi:hypothetical protein
MYASYARIGKHAAFKDLQAHTALPVHTDLFAQGQVQQP